MTWPSSFQPAIYKGPHTNMAAVSQAGPGWARQTRRGSHAGSRTSLWELQPPQISLIFKAPNPAPQGLLNHEYHGGNPVKMSQLWHGIISKFLEESVNLVNHHPERCLLTKAEKIWCCLSKNKLEWYFFIFSKRRERFVKKKILKYYHNTELGPCHYPCVTPRGTGDG